MTDDELKVKVNSLVVKARKVGKDTHCDIGVELNGKFEPMIETRIIKNTSPAIHHLAGEINRLERIKANKIQGDLRLRMALSFLSTAVLKLF